MFLISLRAIFSFFFLYISQLNSKTFSDVWNGAKEDLLRQKQLLCPLSHCPTVKRFGLNWQSQTLIR